jgi:hypothetical protein
MRHETDERDSIYSIQHCLIPRLSQAFASFFKSLINEHTAIETLEPLPKAFLS